jgi:hypothetical protein
MQAEGAYFAIVSRSPEISEAAQRSWQKNVFKIRNAGTYTYSQATLSESIVKIEYAIKLLLSDDIYANFINTGALDLKNPKLIKALVAIVGVIFQNGRIDCLRYYLSPKTTDKLEPFLIEVCVRILDLSNYTRYRTSTASIPPEVLVPYWLAAIIAWAYDAGWSLDNTNLLCKSDKLSNNLAKITQFRQMDRFMPEEQRSPATISPCNKYVEQLGSSVLSANVLMAMVNNSKMAIRGSMCFDNCPVFLDDLQENFRRLRQKVEFERGCYYRNTDPRSFCLHPTGVFALNRPIKRASAAYISFMKQNSSVPSALQREWRQLADAYLEFLKLMVNHIKTIVKDNYYLATLQQLLLTSMLSGISKSVSFEEIATLCKEMKAAAELCAEWAPPVWKKEIKNDIKIVEDEVLPFLKAVNPSPTAKIDVVDSGVFEIFKKAERSFNNENKACAACGRSPVNIMKCSGVSYA